MTNNTIKGIFLIKRNYENTVSLLNKTTNSQEILDYFIFKDKLSMLFDIDKTNKILDYINCGEKILIDFDKKIAKRIIDKEFDFKNVIKTYLNPKNIENELNDPYLEEDVYSRFRDL